MLIQYSIFYLLSTVSPCFFLPNDCFWNSRSLFRLSSFSKFKSYPQWKSKQTSSCLPFSAFTSGSVLSVCVLSTGCPTILAPLCFLLLYRVIEHVQRNFWPFFNSPGNLLYDSHKNFENWFRNSLDNWGQSCHL